MSEIKEQINLLRKTASMLRQVAETPEVKTASISDNTDVLSQIYFEGRLNTHLKALGGK